MNEQDIKNNLIQLIGHAAGTGYHNPEDVEEWADRILSSTIMRHELAQLGAAVDADAPLREREHSAQKLQLLEDLARFRRRIDRFKHSISERAVNTASPIYAEAYGIVLKMLDDCVKGAVVLQEFTEPAEAINQGQSNSTLLDRVNAAFDAVINAETNMDGHNRDTDHRLGITEARNIMRKIIWPKPPKPDPIKAALEAYNSHPKTGDHQRAAITAAIDAYEKAKP